MKNNGNLKLNKQLLTQPGLSSNEKLIASLATEDKYKYSEIAEMLGLNNVTVYRGMNRLVKHGVLRCLERKNACYEYKFCNDKHVPIEPAIESTIELTSEPTIELTSEPAIDPGDIPIFKRQY